MEMTNFEIYQHAQHLNKSFADKDQSLPARFNFYIQRNMRLLIQLTEEIEESRMHIVTRYGNLAQDGQSYIINPEHIATAQQELDDLFAIKQEVNLTLIPEEYLTDNIVLSMEQMDALFFMIQENQDKKE